MIDTTKQLKINSHHRRNFLVACAVAVCVIAIYVLWRANVWPNLFGASLGPPLSSARAQLPLSPNARAFGVAGAAQILVASTSRPVESDWTLFLKKLTALLRGPKVEVCGLSDFEAAKYIAGDAEIDDKALTTTLTAVRAQIDGNAKPQEKAFGLYVESRLAEWPTITAYQARTRICGDDFDCMINIMNTTKEWETTPAAPVTATAPLVVIALAERDPAVIAAALYACRGDRTGACATISYADWVAVEPDNAVPWLNMADAALHNKDSAARDDALRRAAAASGYDARVPSLAPLWNAELIQTQSSLVRYSIGAQLASSQIGTTHFPIYALSSFCKTDGLDDAQKKLCDTLANKLLDQDDTVIGLAIAIFIGKTIGWDEARLQALREQKAVALGMMGDMSSRANMYSCESLAKQIQEAQPWLLKTDRAIIRDRIASSGKSFAEFVEIYRERSPNSFK